MNKFQNVDLTHYFLHFEIFRHLEMDSELSYQTNNKFFQFLNCHTHFDFDDCFFRSYFVSCRSVAYFDGVKKSENFFVFVSPVQFLPHQGIDSVRLVPLPCASFFFFATVSAILEIQILILFSLIVLECFLSSCRKTNVKVELLFLV